MNERELYAVNFLLKSKDSKREKTHLIKMCVKLILAEKKKKFL